MVELADYERRGDSSAPFQLTRRHDRAQEGVVRSRLSVVCDVPPLTWEEYLAGKPCPGCGLPYRGEVPWDHKGTMHFTEEERSRHDAEEARFKKLHGDCHGVSGSITIHCGRCCPSVPFSSERREAIVGLLAEIAARPKLRHELMRWRLRLYCGHVVERTAYFTNTTLGPAFTGRTKCDQCGLDPAAIVDGAAIGLLEEPPAAAEVPAVA